MVSLSGLAEALMYGLSLGMLYILVALGLTMIFGLMDVINFAHGAMITLGAYIGVRVIGQGFSFWAAAVVGAFSVGVLGLVIERYLVRRLYGINLIYQLLLTFGIALVIEGAIILFWGQTYQQLSAPPSLTGNPVTIGGVNMPSYRVFIIVTATLLVTAIYLTLQSSRLGLIIKAGMEDRERTQLLGINLELINLLIFGVGGVLAGLAGVLAAPLFGVQPTLGTNFLLISFIIIVMGGLGNVKGTIVSGLIIGILYNFGLFFYPKFAEVGIFALLIAVILYKPEGIYGGEVA
jgi:branched-subunit amino acid ABC-type transport system permease component